MTKRADRWGTSACVRSNSKDGLIEKQPQSYSGTIE
jgi:hypothetical protein